MASPKDQQHPLYQRDRQVIDTLLNSQPTEYNLAELGRLRIRYRGFPGARDIQSDLDKALQQWHLTEEQLYEKTRQIHTTAKVYRSTDTQGEDWS